MLADRVKEASLLWHAGKVQKILVSGDHGTWTYDEPDTMRKALVARRGEAGRHLRGPRRLRHLGDDGPGPRRSSTSTNAVVVTQGFHMPRALFLAEEAGIHATGLLADQHHWGYQGERSEVREVFSRVKAIWDTTVDTPGDGRPADPDPDLRRPRKLGSGAAARHAARGLTGHEDRGRAPRRPRRPLPPRPRLSASALRGRRRAGAAGELLDVGSAGSRASGRSSSRPRARRAMSARCSLRRRLPSPRRSLRRRRGTDLRCRSRPRLGRCRTLPGLPGPCR